MSIDTIKINESDWFLTISRSMSFWHQYLSHEGHLSHLKDFGLDIFLEGLSVTIDGTQTHVFRHEPNYGQYNQKVLDFIQSEKNIKDLKNKYFHFAKNLQVSLDECNKNLNSLTLNGFFRDYRIFCAGLMLTATIGRIGGESLFKKLKGQGFDESEVPKILSQITYPKDHTPFFQSQLELVEIGETIQADGLARGNVDKNLHRWLNKYQHIPVNFCEEPWTIADAKSQLEAVLKKDCKQELANLTQSHRKKISQKKEWLKEINNREITTLAEAIAEGTYLNEFRKNIFSKTSLGYRGFFKKIAKRADSGNWRDCFYLVPNEMIDILKDKKIILTELIIKRRIVGLQRTEDQGIEFLPSGLSKKIFKHIHELHQAKKEVSAEQPIIRGLSANLGKVKGTAKIILNSKDFHRLLTGDILVTTMTSVDFVPIMEKAAAFVTNEGGITSHASIVAREMNKPCIIGTKIATKVLKDGDMIEVDANKGVVRILKRAK